MRSCYLVSYDISDPKRWRRIYRIMRGFGDPLHYSVFRCELSKTEAVLLMEALSEAMHHDEDRIMLIRLGPANSEVDDRMVFLGRRLETVTKHRVAVIV